MKTKKITPLFYLFLIGIFFESLDAFSLFSIPMPWIGVSIFIFVYVIYYFFGFEIEFNQFDSLRVLLLYITSVTLIRAVAYSPDLPEFATSTFTQYISLRLLKLLGLHKGPLRFYKSYGYEHIPRVDIGIICALIET